VTAAVSLGASDSMHSSSTGLDARPGWDAVAVDGRAIRPYELNSVALIGTTTWERVSGSYFDPSACACQLVPATVWSARKPCKPGSDGKAGKLATLPILRVTK